MTEYTVTYTAEITEIYQTSEYDVSKEEYLCKYREQLIRKGNINATHAAVRDYKVFINDKTKNKNKP